MTQIGFVGASGLMGHGMAKNLLAAGHALSYVVHRRRPEGLDAARAVGTPAELGRTCEVVFLCVTAATDVEGVVRGLDGLLSDPREGLIIVDASTSEPTTTRALAADCAARGVRFVDAPLTRGPKEAEEGRLNTLVGADDATLAEIRPLLEAYSESVFHCGPTGAGNVVKLLNNFVVFAAANAVAEAFAVARKADVDPAVLVDVLANGTFANAILGNIAKTLDGDFSAMAFQLDNARKDLRYYTRLAGELGALSLVGDGVHEALVLASALGYGAEFVPSVVKAQAHLNGLRIGTSNAASA